MESRFLEVAGKICRRGRCDANCIRQGYKIIQLAGSRDRPELLAHRMALDHFAKKLVPPMARVITQCGMVPQVVAFNMFLVFFSSLMFVVAWNAERSR